MNHLSAFGERLEIVERCVSWLKDGALVQKFTYPEGIMAVAATFTYFRDTSEFKPGTTERPVKQKAIAVLTNQSLHVYYHSGPTHVISLPCQVKSIMGTDRGLIIARDSSYDEDTIESLSLPNFFILTDPLLEFGSIVSSSVGSISMKEEMLFFGNAENSGDICVTYDTEKLGLNVYYIRQLSQLPSPLISNFGLKTKDLSRRKSSRVSTGHFAPVDMDSPRQSSFFGSRLDPAISFTREFGGLDFLDPSIPPSAQYYNGIQNSHKEISLSLIESFRLTSTIGNIKIDLITLKDKYCVTMFDEEQQKVIFLLFEPRSSHKTYKFKSSLRLDASYLIPVEIGYETKRSAVLVLTPESAIYFYEPFTQIRSSVIQFPSEMSQIRKFVNYGKSTLAITDEGLYSTEIIVRPETELVEKCFKLIEIILESHEFISFNFLWASILFAEDDCNEWDAFVMAIMLMYIPESVFHQEDHPLISNPDRFSKSEKYQSYLRIIHNLPSFSKDVILNISSFHRQLIHILFLVKEDSKLDIALGRDLESVENLMLHLLSWSQYDVNWPKLHEYVSENKIPGMYAALFALL